MSRHSMSMGFRSGLSLGNSEVLILIFLKPFRSGPADVFWIIDLLQNPSLLQLEVTDGWLDILLQNVLDCRIHRFIYHSKSSSFFLLSSGFPLVTLPRRPVLPSLFLMVKS